MEMLCGIHHHHKGLVGMERSRVPLLCRAEVMGGEVSSPLLTLAVEILGYLEQETTCSPAGTRGWLRDRALQDLAAP